MELQAKLDTFEIKLISACAEIYSTLGSGYKECVYQRALSLELFNNNYKHSTEVNVNIMYKNTFIGYERADILIDDPKRIIELKAQTQKIAPKEIFQTHRYLVDLGITTGYLVNFAVVNYRVDLENITNSIEIFKIESTPDKYCKVSRFDGEKFCGVS
jgi:GxxExxY protein